MSRPEKYLATKVVAITPADSAISGGPILGFYVGTAGNVSVRAVDDSADVTLVGCTAGSYHPIACSRINSTNTTASNIVGLR